jgi:hypothetical protein
VAEQARIAELVRDLDRRLEVALAEAERDRAALAPLLEVCGHQLAEVGGWSGACLLPAGHPGPRGLPGWAPPPRRGQRFRVAESWIDHARPLPAVFADAFTTAVEGLDAPRERLVARLRYGLEGAPGRTFGQIGQTLGRSPAWTRQLWWRAVTSIALAPWARTGPGAPLGPPAVWWCIWPPRCWAIPPTRRPRPACGPLSTGHCPTCDRRSAPSS